MKRRIAIAALLGGMLAGCTTHRAPVEPVAEKAATQEPVATEEVAPQTVVIEKTEQKQERNTVMILMKTSKGDITLALDKEKAPKTVENFLKYVNEGHYTGTIFHRVISNFMIQGGGFTPTMSQKNAPHTVANEADNGLSNDIGTIAMARTSDPHSAGAQFFINVKNNGFLNHSGKTTQGWGYCVFGKVVEGMDVVNAIKAVPTGRHGMFDDVPQTPVIITEVVVLDD